MSGFSGFPLISFIWRMWVSHFSHNEAALSSFFSNVYHKHDEIWSVINDPQFKSDISIIFLRESITFFFSIISDRKNTLVNFDIMLLNRIFFSRNLLASIFKGREKKLFVFLRPYLFFFISSITVVSIRYFHSFVDIFIYICNGLFFSLFFVIFY